MLRRQIICSFYNNFFFDIILISFYFLLFIIWYYSNIKQIFYKIELKKNINKRIIYYVYVGLLNKKINDFLPHLNNKIFKNVTKIMTNI
jgi:hypothetical protein